MAEQKKDDPKVAEKDKVVGKKTYYFTSSQPSANIHLPKGGDPVRFQRGAFSTEDAQVAEFIRTEFVAVQRGPLCVKEVNESEYKRAQQAPLSGNVADGSQMEMQTNADGQKIVVPVIEPLPNRMTYPQPPENQPQPSPGPHVAPPSGPEVQQTGADKK